MKYMKKSKYIGTHFKFKKNSITKTKQKYKTTCLYLINTILKYKKYLKAFQKELNIEDDNTIVNNLILSIMESTGKDLKLSTFKVYSSSSFSKRAIKAFQKIRKIEKKQNMKSNLKIVKVYKMIENGDYKELRLLAISKPKEFLKGIYLYTICED